jgi:hypothetical protein
MFPDAKRAALLSALVLSTCPLLAQSATFGDWARGTGHANGTTFQSLSNAHAARSGEELTLTRETANHPMHLEFAKVLLIGVQRDRDQWWVLPLLRSTPRIEANTILWVLPEDANSAANAWSLKIKSGQATATLANGAVSIDIDADAVAVSSYEGRPHSDVFGHPFSVAIEGHPGLESALAGFYWGTMLPLVAERTMAAHYSHSDGYVLSTLMVSKYAGTYPAVDHEFQIAGRLAMGSPFDLDLVRRMLDLQFRLMREDPEGLFRAPCSLQPDGHAEYYIRRNSKDLRENAAMFPLTGNIEVISESWHYYEMSKDSAWLKNHISDLEHAAGWTMAHVDSYGRLWSDVYYEDQVIKDGRETEAQAFAAHSFKLLAQIETLLARQQKAHEYAEAERRLSSALIQPLPMGFWDQTHQRFTDWVDKLGQPHDHIHLAANTVPVIFSYATPAQAAAVSQTIVANDAEFERFPSFIAAHVEDYTPSEMGTAGPYDLSAAGRYWFWDAAYRASTGDSRTLLHQLDLVAVEAIKNSFYMGERYDMDHVYYVDGKNAHGAVQYFEYPNVFTSVLITDVLGITKVPGVDIALKPHLAEFASARFETPGYALQYAYTTSGFKLRNLSDKRRTFQVDLSSVGDGHSHFKLAHPSASARSALIITLAPHAEVMWVTEK